jgi:hypothetical protein
MPGVSSDIGTVVTFPDPQASAGLAEPSSGSGNGRVHFQDMNGEGDDSFGYHDTGTRNLPQRMTGHSALNGSMHTSATGVFGDGNDTSLNGHSAAPLYSRPHSSISASFEPLFLAMDVMIQQEDAMQLTPGMQQSTMMTGTTPSRVPINYDFMSLWDEGSYDDLLQSPSYVSVKILSLDPDLNLVVL